MEIEWGGAFSTGGNFTFPSTVKYTPEGPYLFWGRTEFSASFDSLGENSVSATLAFGIAGSDTGLPVAVSMTSIFGRPSSLIAVAR